MSKTYLCARKNSDVFIMPNSVIRKCDFCDEDIWIAPTTRDLLLYSPGTLICFECLEKNDLKLNKMVPLTQAQWDEVKPFLKGVI
jgi:hypothetical protein